MDDYFPIGYLEETICDISRTLIADIDDGRIDDRPREPLPPLALACPFLKHDPVKHRVCIGLRLPRVRDVKQHLILRHTPINYCTRCSKTFASEDDLDEHFNPPDGILCTPCTRLDGLHSEQRAELCKESKTGMSVDEQWFEIWDIVFPDTQRPRTAYFDNETPYRELHFSNYSSKGKSFPERRHSGPSILDHAGDVDVGLLREASIDVSVDPPNPDTPKPQDDPPAVAFPSGLTVSGLKNDVTLSELMPRQATRHNLQSVYPSPDISSDPIIRNREYSSTSSHSGAESLDPYLNYGYIQHIEPEYTPRKPNVPFTDSGYASTSRNDTFQYAQLPQNSSERDEAEPKDAIIEDDNRTIYSANGSLLVSSERQYISEACQSIRDRLGYHVDPERWTFSPGRLPELLKAFAIKIGLESTDQENLRVMWFFHKYGEKIASQLLCNDSETENMRDDGKSMPLEDKLSLWWDEARCSISQIDENHCTDDEDISLGGEDEGNTSGEDNDDQDIEDTEASSHNKTVLESSAFRWLVRSLRNEMALQEDRDGTRGHDSRVHVRKKILHHLATGKISKSRSPIVHKVMVRLCNWPMIAHKEVGMLNAQHSDTRTFDSMVSVCCGSNSQLLSIKQYVQQTWPSTCYQIMSLLQDSSNDNDAETFVVTLPDRTQLVALTEHSDLVLGVSGPAHTIAECIEQLAWVLAALCFPCGYSDGISQHGPIISEPHKVPNDPMHRVLRLMQPPPGDEHYTCFDINIGASDQSLTSAGPSKLISAFSGRHVMVPGYPILRRPAACLGIEIPPEHVLKLREGLVLVQQDTGV